MDKKTYSRRSFINKLWLALGAVTFAEIITMVIVFFRPRKMVPSLAKEDALIIAGPVDHFEPGTVSTFVRGRFYLARLDDGGFLAMSHSCTHLGCSVPWVEKENRFICPCHSSEYDITGEVAAPPAPRALDLYPVRIENDILKVDTSRSRKRTGFAADQVTYPNPT
jgi:cytochrome b6-f complex iron-sulfur subunit